MKSTNFRYFVCNQLRIFFSQNWLLKFMILPPPPFFSKSTKEFFSPLSLSVPPPFPEDQLTNFPIFSEDWMIIFENFHATYLNFVIFYFCRFGHVFLFLVANAQKFLAVFLLLLIIEVWKPSPWCCFLRFNKMLLLFPGPNRKN